MALLAGCAGTNRPAADAPMRARVEAACERVKATLKFFGVREPGLYDIEVTGDFSTLGRFVHMLERAAPVVSFDALTIRGRRDTGVHTLKAVLRDAKLRFHWSDALDQAWTILDREHSLYITDLVCRNRDDGSPDWMRMEVRISGHDTTRVTKLRAAFRDDAFFAEHLPHMNPKPVILYRPEPDARMEFTIMLSSSPK